MFIEKHALVLLAVWSIFLLGVSPGAAEIYKWVDEQGRMHFQDHPPQEAGKVSELEVRDSSPRVSQEIAPVPPVVVGSQGQAAVASVPVDPLRTTPRIAQVELYTVDWCPWCRKAREFFRSQGVSFTDYNIEKDAAAAVRKKEQDPEKNVPFAIVNGVKIHGFKPEAYARALKTPAPGSP